MNEVPVDIGPYASWNYARNHYLCLGSIRNRFETFSVGALKTTLIGIQLPGIGRDWPKVV